MTQALNLSQFANKLNTSGQTDNTGLQNNSITINTTSPITGGATTALGSSLTIAHANSGVAANTYTAATITVNAQGHITAASSNTVGAGTVTSVATGNGLSGGTITSTGTLSVACPGFNTVGSYACIGAQGFTPTPGSNYGTGNPGLFLASTDGISGIFSSAGISGTWKWLGASEGNTLAIACRVS